MTVSEFVPNPYALSLDQGTIKWQSPSNIALVKYWGKFADQIPANPSISFTLDACRTTTSLQYVKLDESADSFDFEVLFEGESSVAFRPKIQTFFERIYEYLPFLKDYSFRIETSNSFPHSSGIASSASGMSALALCLMSMERLMNSQMSDTEFNNKASFLARLGSGSAARSIEGPLVVWGRHDSISGSSDLFGMKYEGEVHDNFQNYNDLILLVDEGEKLVSSTEGHGLMTNHPFAQSRFDQAHKNLSALIPILESGDLNAFNRVVEEEALSLHAMMMSSNPSFILMKPNTLAIIERIRHFRQQTGLHPCFTLDAGANVHLLFPENESEAIYEFVKNELIAFCQNEHYICDRIGFGAKQLPI